jgi:hypothetical protein
MRISQSDVNICHHTDEIGAIPAVTESTEKDLCLTQVRLSQGEFTFGQLASEVQPY